jgi:hypothetical protein
MIDKNFYLENLSAFDILIQDDREKAQEVIFRVFSSLQRDKIWLREVAAEEEIFEEDAVCHQPKICSRRRIRRRRTL